MYMYSYPGRRVYSNRNTNQSILILVPGPLPTQFPILISVPVHVAETIPQIAALVVRVAVFFTIVAIAVQQMCIAGAL